jgi:hydrogenase maturation protein HypF
VGERLRLRVQLFGTLDESALRTFVDHLARSLRLHGWCESLGPDLAAEVEGDSAGLTQFLHRLERDRPARAAFAALEAWWLDATGLGPFEPRAASSKAGPASSIVLPDLAPCHACSTELLDPSNRRYRYPFISCAFCGPRHSIITALPYERDRTSMRGFRMCPACRREYEHAHGRRYRAEANACPACGPHLALWNPDGDRLATDDAAMLAALGALRSGRILAVKGPSGFHLLVSADDDAAVVRLREHKGHGAKPFAMMYADLAAAAEDARLHEGEARLLSSPARPIVLAEMRPGARPALARIIAPDCALTGAMLPSTALHLILLRDLGGPAVMTSGNRSGDPPCVDERDALERLRGVADVFLVHNRPIAHAADDSVVRVACGREIVLRRGRGYAPLPIPLTAVTTPVAGAGGDRHSTMALVAGRHVFLTPPIGDVCGRPAVSTATAWRSAMASLESRHRVEAASVAVEADPESLSARHARALGRPVVEIPHHEAHLWACLAENDLEPPVVGAVWDDGGLGRDGTEWGGDFLRLDPDGADAVRRAACLRPFHLPGLATADRGSGSLVPALLAACGDTVFERWLRMRPGGFTASEHRALRQSLARDPRARVTTSASRFRDIVLSLLGPRVPLADPLVDGCYPFAIGAPDPAWMPGEWDPPPLVVDWAPMVDALLADLQRGVAGRVAAARVRNTMAEMIVRVAVGLGERRLALTGECFEPQGLLERTVARLRAAGVRAYWPQRLPPNDEALAAGQAIAASRRVHDSGAR